MIDMFIPLFMVMVPQVCAYVQTRQNVYIKFDNFLYSNYTLIKFKKHKDSAGKNVQRKNMKENWLTIKPKVNINSYWFIESLPCS